ncbi:MAG: hypothetical protein QNJ46_26290 [Leptolyngbyaceae cyanobacterium MO_188.B28]|nr:hypothetical protein [Leptolyngbyaceae cyanobacterium MO_188.B28]
MGEKMCIFESKISESNPFQVIEPEFCLGQQVKTRSDLVGYILGLIFYPDVNRWCYGIHIPNYGNGGIHEIWYYAEELEIYDGV